MKRKFSVGNIEKLLMPMVFKKQFEKTSFPFFLFEN